MDPFGARREYLAELDALVLAEVRALQPRPAPPGQRHAPPELPRARPAPRPDAAAPPRAAPDLALLDMEDRAFVDRTVAWLRGRPNPDIVADALWAAIADAPPAQPAADDPTADALPAGDAP